MHQAPFRYIRGPGLLPRDGELPVFAEEFVEGLAEQGLDRAVLHDAEQAQLAVDGRGKVAGDGDAAGAAVPGRAGRGVVSPSGRESTLAKGLSVSGISVSHVMAQPRSEGADLASRLAAGVRLRHGQAQGQAVREGGTHPDAGRRDRGPVVAHGGLGEIRRPAARRIRSAGRYRSRGAPPPSKSAATWTASVVLPVPPFWANSAMVYIASATLPSLSRMRPPG